MIIDPSNGSGTRRSAQPFADPDRLQRAMEACRLGLWEWRIADEVCLVNPPCCELLGLSPGTSTFSPRRLFDLVHEGDIALLNESIEAATRLDDPLVQEFRIRREDTGELRWLAVEARVVERGQDGEALVMSGVSFDVTRRRREQEATELLNQEIGHRMKNVLAVVSSLVTLSGEHRPEARDFITSFHARLNSLADTHELLLHADWRPVPLGRLYERVLEPLGVLDRIDMAGDRDFLLGSNDAQTLGLVLHELATNAIKYGALSNGAGRVALDFEVTVPRPNECLLVLRWEETGGPPVATPNVQGFGLDLLGRLARRHEHVEPMLQWRGAGLYCCFPFRLTPPKLSR